MKYGIYFTRSNSNDDYQISTKGWYTETPYSTLKAAKAALEGIACMLNEDFYKCTYKDRLTLEGVRTDNLQRLCKGIVILPPPITDKVTFKICVYHY